MYVREVPGSLQDADRGALILGASVGAGLAADGVLEVERDLLRSAHTPPGAIEHKSAVQRAHNR